MRFRTEQHLRRQSDIRGVREQGRRVECRAFTLWWRRRNLSEAGQSLSESSSAPIGTAKTAPAATPDSAQPRVCVIASTAAVGNAVRRARAKRRLREIFRQHQALVPPDCDLLLIARGTVLEWPLAALEKKFSEACGQISPRPTPPS